MADDDTPSSDNETRDPDAAAAPPDTDEPDKTRVGLGGAYVSPQATREPVAGAVEVFSPYRRVVLTTDDGTRLPLDGLDVDVTVTQRGDGARSWSVAAYNVADRLWDQLRLGTHAEIRVGWKDGPQTTAVRGPIQLMRPSPWRSGYRYIMRGISRYGAQLGKRLSQTWTDEPPHRIVRDVAQLAGLDVGHIAGETPPLDGNWTLTAAKPLSHWLGELTLEAARNTDEEWAWYITDGKIFFVPRGTPTGPPLRLDYRTGTDKLQAQVGGATPKPRRPTPAVGADPESGLPRSVPRERSFQRKLEPEVYRGRIVDVVPPGTPDADPTAYVVSGFQFESSSRTGRHYVHGTLIPVQTTYRPQFYRDSDDDDARTVRDTTSGASN